MHKAEVTDHIHNPEVLVASGGLHDLLGRGKLDQCGVLQLCMDRNYILRMVLDGAGGCVLRGTNRWNSEGNRRDEDEFAVHAATPWEKSALTPCLLFGSIGNRSASSCRPWTTP